MEWGTTKEMAIEISREIKARMNIDLPIEDLESIVQEALIALTYDITYKVAMLSQDLKESILRGDYGPLNTSSGSRTQAGEIGDTFREIFSAATLSCFDERGNYIC